MPWELIFGIPASLVGAFWVFYTYQNEHKPILNLRTIQGRSLGMHKGLQNWRMDLEVSKTGTIPTHGTQIFTAFLDCYPALEKHDMSFSAFPDIVTNSTESFSIEKFVPTDYYVKATNSPGFMLMLLSVRWKASSWMYWRRVFSFRTLFRVTSRLIEENGKTTMVFQFSAMKGPSYSQKFVWEGEERYFNGEVSRVLQGETLNSVLELDALDKKGGKHWQR